MVVACKVGACPYCSKSGFCRNRVVVINQNGQCGHLYTRDGRVREHWRDPVEQMYMDGYRKKENVDLIAADPD